MVWRVNSQHTAGFIGKWAELNVGSVALVI
jgi:hypothetical protein